MSGKKNVLHTSNIKTMSHNINRPLVLNHGSLESTILIPTSNYHFYQQLRDGFSTSLPEATEGFASDEEPSSKAELLMKFLGYIVESGGLSQEEKSEAVLLVLNEFETRFLSHADIHTLAAKALLNEELPTSLFKVKENLIRNYYLGKTFVDPSFGVLNAHLDEVKASLFKAALNGDALVHAIFGGQGNTDDYFEELREINRIYHGLVGHLLTKCQDKVKTLIRSHPDAKKVYTQGFDLLGWLDSEDKTPDSDYLLSIPVSCPLICVIQLCHYVVTCRVLGLTPGHVGSLLKGATGHSQGLVTAVVVAAADSWDSFEKLALQAVELLFYIGVRCLQVYPNTSLPPSMSQDSVENSEGKPSPMLSISNLSYDQVSKFVAETNSHLPEQKHIDISLVNGARNLVVTGPPQSLYGLNLSLRKAKAPSGLDQARIPHSERKLKFSSRFLPILSPFHSHLLAPATDRVVEDLEKAGLEFESASLKIPVYDTFDGSDLRDCKTSIAARLVKCITQLPVNWEKATTFQTTHLLDFGPGGSSGLGVLTHRNKDGTGVRVIIAGVLDQDPEDSEYGYKQELFDRFHAVKYSPNWLKQFSPKLVKTPYKMYVDTKFSRLLGRAPLMVPGMTPSTVSPDFVSATLNAGYHIELAGGGYFTSPMMKAALQKVVDQVEPGTGVSVNLIYVNPRMLQWGIPMIKELRDMGFPLQSLTIGAGVPSLEVATEYIETLGLTHLGLKPGSIDAIHQCIAIAKAHPKFPIVVQWTGGRGGGHHSFEDFHQPLLQMYTKLRRCSNIVLVAGSGFGSAEDAFPYISGTWSTVFDYPEMPFDGVLFGSRVMTALECETSKAAKQAIVDCPGVSDAEWEKTYKGPTGGIVTVRSEMGEPIHKIATRGVMLWKELDETVFNQPKNKLLGVLEAKKDYIIQKLNADFQKPWFGKNANGPCDLQEMTYQQVAERLVELIYVRKSQRWIDVSLRNLVGTFLRRVEERFAETKKPAILQSFNQLSSPDEVVKTVFAAYPKASTQLINEEDCDYFLMCCESPTQKPVPFVPVLGPKFEFFFKKDSLWQSEDLEAVVDEDVQRTCILCGPVAAKYANKVDEPIKEILDGVHDGMIKYLLEEHYFGDESRVPKLDYFGPDSQIARDYQSALKRVESLCGTSEYSVGQVVPSEDDWFKVLAGPVLNWRHAFFSSQRLVQGSLHVANAARQVFSPKENTVLRISSNEITLLESQHGKMKEVVSVSLKGDIISMQLIEHRTADGNPVSLPLQYLYKPQDGFAPIVEVMANRNERIKKFYWHLWFGSNVPFEISYSVHDPIESGAVEITQQQIADFTHAVGNSCEAFVYRAGKETLAPMDFAIVIGWKAIMKAIFPSSVDGDLLKLVHLSNGYKCFESLKVGDFVSTSAEVRSVVNQATGKTVEVVGTLIRSDGVPVMEVSSSFFYRGKYSDFQNSFEKKSEAPAQVKFESPRDVAVLKSKEWFHLLDESTNLLGETLTFECKSQVSYKNESVFSSVTTTGVALLELPSKEVVQVAEILYEAGETHGNPVVEYLTRVGSSLEQAVMFENAIPIGSEISTKAPGTNEPYALVSGDYNPIHVSRVFASYANLPGTITHGMYSCASVRALVETWAADNVAARVRAFKADFVGMVLPNEVLVTSMEHVGMVNGRKIVRIVTAKQNGETVLQGEAEVEQPVSTFVFTGQGSQEQGMGMDLYGSSEVARSVWDRADSHFVNNYGFSILDIVRNNPPELTVHFGGTKGRAIKENYVSMMFETVADDGSLRSEKIFKEITESTTSYTFRAATGLLSATQFTQPALTLMEKASFEDMKAKGLVPADSMFAGHSLGEYSALTSLGDVMPIESLVDVVFYRGMTMQVAVPRDSLGRSNYSMCAVNPSRVSPSFNDTALRFVVQHISSQTGWLLEIVNYNVENSQYVTAGDLRALDTLSNTLNVIKLQKIDLVKLLEMMPLEKVAEHLTEIVGEVAKKSVAKPQPIDLERGFACIPLKGISVPFHSSYLRSGVKPFQRFLIKKIPKSAVKPANLIGKYIPNLTAKPFEITKEYFEDVYKLTNSEKIKSILENWESYEQ